MFNARSSKSSDFGYDQDELVNWDVGGNTDCVGTIVGESGTTVQNRHTIQVRYDNASAGPWRDDACEVVASKGAATKLKARTVFKGAWTINTSQLLHSDNPRRFPPFTGDDDTDHARFNWEGDHNAELIAAKQEGILTFSPTGIDWGARGVKFVYENAQGKSSLRLHRLTIRAALVVWWNAETPRILEVNDANWVYDGKADPEDAAFPTAEKPDRAFRLDWPKIGPGPEFGARQGSVRLHFIEISEWYDGAAWVRYTPDTDAKWYVNISINPPDATKGSPNNHGAGHLAANVSNNKPVANAGPNDTCSVTSPVTLNGGGSTDADPDSLTYKWTQTAGTPVTLSDVTAIMPTFTAPEAPTTLEFELKVKDKTSELHHFKPGNSESEPDTVAIEVVES